MTDKRIDQFTPYHTSFDPAADYLFVRAGGTATSKGMLGQYLFARNLSGSGFLASATDVIFGRSSAGAGAVQEIACTSFARTVLDDASASAARSTLSAAVLGANNDITSMSGLTGAIQAPTQINDANGNEVLKFSSVGSAINEVTVENTAGTNVILKATGASTNVNINIEQKGAAAIYLGVASCTGLRLVADQPILDSSGNEYLKFSKTASAVNELTITNAATGNAPILSATGGDTNIDITLTPKGSGKLVLSSSIVMNDYVFIYNATGNGAMLQLAKASGTQVNWLLMISSATGNNPVLQSSGGDANVGLTIATQGTGDLFLSPGGVVKFGTFTSDATVTQAGYITVKDSGGTTRYLSCITP